MLSEMFETSGSAERQELRSKRSQGRSDGRYGQIGKLSTKCCTHSKYGVEESRRPGEQRPQ